LKFVKLILSYTLILNFRIRFVHVDPLYFGRHQAEIGDQFDLGLIVLVEARIIRFFLDYKLQNRLNNHPPSHN